MENLAEKYSHFVSLGDNCEFGFAQRNHGVENGALLRWAIVPPDALLACLRSRFENLYLFDNLAPFATDMVRDSGTGLCFHSELSSSEVDGILSFRSSLELRREMYTVEVEKINYMRSKLISQLESGTNIFVYKRNEGCSLAFCSELSECLRSYNPNNILLIVESAPLGSQSLLKLNENLYVGQVEGFAPYNKADQIEQKSWDFVVSQMFNSQLLDDANIFAEDKKIDLVGEQALDWSKGIAHELWFWSRWFETRGLDWQSDFEMRLNPQQPLISALAAQLPNLVEKRATILDVGAGPMTNIGFAHEGISVEVQACDPLADFYSRVAEKQGIERPVPTVFAVVEDLTSYFAEDSFDIVHCCNALDHSADPMRGITEMLRVVRRNGVVYLKHHINEAETENYEGFHQFNFDLRDGRFVVWNKSDHWDVASVLPVAVDIKAHLEAEDIVVVIKKLEDFDEAQRVIQLKGRLRQFQRAFILKQTQAAVEQLEVTSGGAFSH